MSDPFIGEIVMFGGSFNPRGWSNCDGQLLAINQNQALFSILGTMYGGDGETTFGLPDLRGRVPIHVGTGAGLTPRTQGQKGGAENVTLITNQLPSHSHAVAPAANSNDGDTDEPGGNYPAKAGGGETIYSNSQDTSMGVTTSGNTGANQSHENMSPFQVVRFIIAIQGIFPSRN